MIMTLKTSSLRSWYPLALAGVLLTGCENVVKSTFEPNYSFAKAKSTQFELIVDKDGKMEDQLDKPLDQLDVLLTKWFGTPDEPKLPSKEVSMEINELLSLDRLKMAAGPAPATKEPGATGLYRQQCATCHGETGHGRGPTAASQNPYPRDFRRGTFKFRTTSRGSKPVREDIERTIRQGLPGSQMQAFDKLTQDQVNSLIDYVIYLSIRGEVERAVLLNLGQLASEGEDIPETIDEAAKEELDKIVTNWVSAKDQVQNLSPGEGVVVADLTNPIDAAALQASIAHGKELFLGSTANCLKCHGPDGKANIPQPADYDDWTKDWTKTANIEVTDTAMIESLMALGAMKPQAILPRNLTEGKYRGGGRPSDIYHRIRFGIEGTPMPGAAMSEGEGQLGLTEKDVWDLVNFVRSLPQSEQPKAASL